jgi:asparagine synthase (glutamine-hydrolysing)
VRPAGQGSFLTPLDVASGLLFGVEERPRVPDRVPTPREALERTVLEALRRPPCIVTFSGGLDSSVVLAVASSVAHREGLELPIAATLRFPGRREADESSWQERVLDDVRVADWQRLELGAELGVVGPVATAVLREHGLLWPFNAYVHVPLFDLARGGSVLTGFGGDELFLPSRWDRLAVLRSRRERPRAADVKRLALAVTPSRLRARVLCHREGGPRLDWLRPEAQAALTAAWASTEASAPIGRRARGMWRLGLRSIRTAARSLGALAASRDVTLVNPLTSTDVVAAFAGDRSHADATRGDRLRGAVGELLPSALFDRRSKAGFNAALWGDEAAALAGDWSGEGVDLSLVDPDAVRAQWRREVVDGRTFTMLQAAWLSRSTTPPGATPAAAGPSPPATRATTADG